MNAPLVSVIITTKNEAPVIAACLKSINNQTYHRIETLVVDNSSTDKTKAIVQSFGAKVLNKGPERSAQRNFGARQAKGDCLLFLDADMELTPRVVEECVNVIGWEAINNKQKDRLLLTDYCPKYLAVVIPEKSFGIGFWAECKALERSFYLNIPWIESARFFQKDVFKKLGGYDEALTGPEDFELPQRLKYEFGENCVGRISSFILHNEGTLSPGKTLKKKYYYGKNMWEYRKKQKSRVYFDKQVSLFARYSLFFRKPIVMVKHPLTFIGMLFLKTLEIGAVALGTITQR